MKRSVIILAVLAFAALSVSAQSFQQALFLDGYQLGYRYNPALANETGFLSMGQWENQSRNNVGAANFLYPRNGEVVTALHESVSADEFLGSLKDDNYLTGNIHFNLFSYGWKGEKAYHTLEAGIRAAYSASVPKEIFTILKLGTGEVSYDLSGINVAGNAVVELAYGYSRKLSDLISVGARAKLLVGIEALRYNVTRFDLTMQEDAYQAQVEADLDLTSRWSKIRANDEGYLDLTKLSSKERWKLPSGAGLALDLGVVITPLEGLTIAASALDLGGILWYYGNAGKSQGTTTFTGMDSLTMDEIQSGKLKEQFKDELDAFVRSIKIKSVKSRTTLEAVPVNLNLGVRYEMPFYRPLAVGLTGTYYGVHGMPYSEVRGALAWNPYAWLGVSANAGAGTFGALWGFSANAAYKQFRLTLAMSNGFGGTIPYSNTPLQPNAKTLTLGLSYTL